MKILIWVFAFVLIAAGAYWFLTGQASAQAPSYRTAKIEKGNLSITVTATGTLQAVTTVQVGTQVSGVVSKLFVDFNDHVQEGQVVAQLDTSLLDARLAQDQASLARSEASAAKLDVDRADALRNLNRQKELFAQKIASQTDLDAAQYRLDGSEAEVHVAQAELKQAKAAVQASQINLKNATITSPISGVVISRSVDVGQTVAASLSAPTLFTIANDLSKMWVLANIDEADVGRILIGQEVNFTVDSFPDKTFSGKVRQVRLQPTTVQNVVMYTVVIDVDNPGGILLPGLTANLSVLVDKAEAILRVPNASLRFQPTGEAAVSASTPTNTPPQPGAPGKQGGGSNGAHSGKRRNLAEKDLEPGKPGRVYVLSAGNLKPVELRIGRSDGAFTEVISGELKEGDEIVVGLQMASSSATPAARSPWSGGGGRR